MGKAIFTFLVVLHPILKQSLMRQFPDMQVPLICPFRFNASPLNALSVLESFHAVAPYAVGDSPSQSSSRFVSDTSDASAEGCVSAKVVEGGVI